MVEEISYQAETYKGLYTMHKYWGKKPYNIMADFIKKYTRQNEIVRALLILREQRPHSDISILR